MDERQDRYNSSKDYKGRNRNSRSSSSSQSHSRKNYQTKRDSSSRENSEQKNQEKRNFPILVFIENKYMGLFNEDSQLSLNDLRKKFKLEKIFFDDSQTIPEYDGKTLRIQDESMEKKINTLEEIIKKIGKSNSEGKQKDYSYINLLILIPEGMVSLLIGARGKQINAIMNQSNAEIVVNQPIINMTNRTVKIDGKNYCVIKAMKQIYNLLEEKAPFVKQMEKAPDVKSMSETSTSTQFILPEKIKSYVIGKNGGFVKEICNKYDVLIRFIDDPNNKIIKKDQTLVFIKGKLQQVQSAVIFILRRVNDYYENQKKQYQDHPVKLIIPNSYVTKLIGKSGCMIREIANKSGGAQIIIESDKNQEKHQKECIIQINGTLANKQDAACIILEQIEMFKTGGPILISGKGLNLNLAGQYKHSIQGRESMNEEYNQMAENEEKEKQKKVDSKSRSRSRSLSKSQKKNKSSINDNQQQAHYFRSISEEQQNIKQEFNKNNGSEENDQYKDIGDSVIDQSIEDNNAAKNKFGSNDNKQSNNEDKSYKQTRENERKEEQSQKQRQILNSRSQSESVKRQSQQKTSSKQQQKGKAKNSQSNSYSRSRSRSKSRSPSDSSRERRHKSRSSSNSSSQSQQKKKKRTSTHAKENKRKSISRSSSSRSKGDKRRYSRGENSKNCSYVTRNSKRKIVIQIVVPEYLVPHLIGRGGENNKKIQQISRASVSYLTDSDYRVHTCEGRKGCLTRIEGTKEENCQAFKLIMKDIIDFERKLNGDKYE